MLTKREWIIQTNLLEEKYDHPKINTYLASEFETMIERKTRYCDCDDS